MHGGRLELTVDVFYVDAVSVFYFENFQLYLFYSFKKKTNFIILYLKKKRKDEIINKPLYKVFEGS